MKMILKEQNIQISFGSIVTKMANLRYVVLIFWIQIIFYSNFLNADYPQLYMLGEMLCSFVVRFF